MHVIIIEDEAVIARRLARLVREIDAQATCEIAGDFASASAAVAARPGCVVLLDLNLHGLDGFELLRLGLAEGWRTIVVSAHAERAIEAFELGVVDFVPKPFGTERLKLALERAALSQPKARLRYLVALHATGTVLIALARIVAIHGADDYSEVETVTGQRLLHRKSLQLLSEELPPPFLRIHRSHIVNLEFAAGLDRSDTGTWQLRLENGSVLAVGRRALAELRKALV